MASQQFCLKWNNHSNNMIQVFENLLSTESFVDVTLACDGLSLKAHRMVLSACSPYFQSLFLENPCKHPIVIMKGMNYNDLKAIVDFMYHGEVNVSQDHLSALLRTAETLQVKGLAEQGGQASNLGQDNVPSSQQTSHVPTPTSTSTPRAQQQPQPRQDSAPMHGKRKRARTRKRSSEDSNQSEDESVPTKIKQPDSPDIEELSDNASMERVSDTQRRQQRPINTSQRSRQSSVNSFSSSKRTHFTPPAQVEEPPSAEEEFELEPSKLLVQTLTTDNVPSMSTATSSSTVSSRNFNLPSSSGMQITPVGGSSDNNALVPVSGASDSLSSSHFQGPDSPQDIKPAIVTFEDSPVAGTSQAMVYMDQSSMPGTSGYDDNSLMQDDGQPQGKCSYFDCVWKNQTLLGL